MSYLSAPRLSFSGRFLADVSTVNNDVRHYANDYFEPRFQKPTTAQDSGPPLQNGWWNPSGTGAFRLVDTKVVQAVLAPGQHDAGAIGLNIDAQVERSAAKLVDLDPQMQMASMIYGMRLVLSQNGKAIMHANYRAAAFRDLFFGRLLGSQNSAGASAKFTSVLTGVSWASDMPDLEILTRLHASTEKNGDMLSVNFMTTLFGHFGHFVGLLTGSIGTWKAGSPKSFVAGRRFAVATPGAVATQDGIGFCDAVVSDDATALSVDLSNALPISDTSGKINYLGPLSLAILNTADSGSVESGFKAGIAEGAVVAPGDVTILGHIDDYANAGWLAKTGGLVDIAIPDTVRERLGNHPLALVTSGASESSYSVLIREAVGGLMLRADDFVIRLDAVKDHAVKTQRMLYAAKWGQPAAGIPVRLSLAPRQVGGGGPPDAKPPQADEPAIGPPLQPGTPAVTFDPATTTARDGTLAVTLYGTDPGNPRGFIDGQIYQVNYILGVEGASPMPGQDAIFLHVRDAFDAPEHPDWERDIKPFMQQYDNLYPVMSRNLFSLSDAAVAAQHARLLVFAFEQPEDDPNHMPVTRDLSNGKRQALIRWLSARIPDHAPARPEAAKTVAMDQVPPRPPVGWLSPLSNDAIDAALARLGDDNDGKTNAMRAYLNGQRTK